MNDDMDELFRRAAENYPLNTGNADWNELQKKLAAGTDEKVSKPINRKNYKSLWLLLLLIPAVWIYTGSFHDQNQKASNSLLKNNAGAVEKISPAKSETTVSKTITSPNHSDVVNHPGSYVLQTSGNINIVHHSQTLAAADARVNKTILPAEQPYLVVQPGQSADEKSAMIPPIQYYQDIQTGNDHIPFLVLNDKSINRLATTAGKTDLLNKEQKKKNQKHVRPGLYAGIIIGPDITTIKLQSVKEIGVGMGLLLGYELNKKISVESGLLFDRKYYYTSGEYVNTKRISVPYYSKVKEAQGVCRMIEIPLNVKYTIKNFDNANLFATAGVGSYFMQKEIYDYTFERNGWQGRRHSVYNKSSSDLLAVMNFTVGYTHKLGNAAVRIEPYIKIPLKGVGIGSLPIMSTGINIGIIKKLFTF